jgi:hypothetical protein
VACVLLPATTMPFHSNSGDRLPMVRAKSPADVSIYPKPNTALP